MNHLPEPLHFSRFLHKIPADIRRHAHQRIRLQKTPLCLPHFLLKKRINRITALIDPLKGTRQNRKIFLTDIPQKLRVARKCNLRFLHGLLQPVNGTNIFYGRSASVIADTVAADHPVIVFRPFQSDLHVFHRRRMKPRCVFRRKTDGIYLTAIFALPFKYRSIQPRPHEYIGIHTALFQYLGQHRIVPEAVHVGSNLCHLSETAF